MDRIKKLMKMGYSVEFTEAFDVHYVFITLTPLCGHNTKFLTPKDFKGETIEGTLDFVIEDVQ